MTIPGIEVYQSVITGETYLVLGTKGYLWCGKQYDWVPATVRVGELRRNMEQKFKQIQ